MPPAGGIIELRDEDLGRNSQYDVRTLFEEHQYIVLQ